MRPLAVTMRWLVTSAYIVAFAVGYTNARLTPGQLRKSLMVSPSFSHDRGRIQPQNRNIVLPLHEGPTNRPLTPPGQVNNQRSNRPVVPPGQDSSQRSPNVASATFARNRNRQAVSGPNPGSQIRGQLQQSAENSNDIQTPIIKPIRAGEPMRKNGVNPAITSAAVGDIKANAKANTDTAKLVINDRIADSVNEKSTPVASRITTSGAGCRFSIPTRLLPDPSMTEYEFNITVLIPTIRMYLNPGNSPCITDALKRYIHMLLRWREMAFRI